MYDVLKTETVKKQLDDIVNYMIPEFVKPHTLGLHFTYKISICKMARFSYAKDKHFQKIINI